MYAPREPLGYVVTFDPTRKNGRHDALCVLDLDLKSKTYGKVVGRVEMPNAGRRTASLRMERVQRRAMPLRAASAHRASLSDGARPALVAHLCHRHQARPAKPELVNVIEAEEIASETGYSRPHTVHCGPDAIYVSALGAPNGDGPGGIFLLDHESFDVLGPMGSRSRAAAIRLRLLVASRMRRRGDQRVGHAQHDRERLESRSAAGRQVRASRFTSGICASGVTCKRSISAPKIRWRSNCVPRTIRPGLRLCRRGWFRPRICRRRSGCGIATDGDWTSSKGDRDSGGACRSRACCRPR